MKIISAILGVALCSVIGVTDIASASASVTITDASGQHVTVRQARRIVTVGSDVTEIVYALGAGSRVIVTDANSNYPEINQPKTKLGSRRKLSVEGILAHRPDLILLSSSAGPESTITALRASRVPVVVVPEGRDIAGVRHKIMLVGRLLGRDVAARTLADRVDRQIVAVTTAVRTLRPSERKRVVFIHSVAGGKVSGAAGANTPGNTMITYAGGVNALSAMDGYRQVSAESLASAAPQIVLMSEGSDGRAPSKQEVFSVPALRATPAGRAQSLVTLDGPFMLGFGPRTGLAIRALALKMYPQLTIPIVQ